MKKAICLLFVLFFSVALMNQVYAITMSDEVFLYTTASLSSNKDVSFTLITNYPTSPISIGSCVLQIKTNNNWNDVCTLPSPTITGQGIDYCSAFADYSSYIGTGTYRIKYNATADGHTITRYSNSRTF